MDNFKRGRTDELKNKDQWMKKDFYYSEMFRSENRRKREKYERFIKMSNRIQNR